MRRDAFQDYYAVESNLAAARHLVTGCGNTCAAFFRAVDAAHRGWRGYFARQSSSDAAHRARSDAARQL